MKRRGLKVPRAPACPSELATSGQPGRQGFANHTCAWWYQSKWDWIDFGVRNYPAPVSLTNDWGDDKGVAELTPEAQARVIELFNWWKGQVTRLKWFEKLPEGAN